MGKKMKTSAEIMEIENNKKRFNALRKWMLEHNITFRDVSKQLGKKSPGVAHFALRTRSMERNRHQHLVALGFPADLLPPVRENWYHVRPAANAAPQWPNPEVTKHPLGDAS